MKVPIIDGPSAQSRQLFNSPGPNLARPQTGLAEDLGAAADGVGRAMVSVKDGLARANEGRRKANAIASTGGLTAFQAGATVDLHGDSQAGKQGFLDLQGIDASAVSGRVLESLQKRRLAISQGLNNDEQRADFENRSQALLVDYTRQVEGHVGQQNRVAQRATAKALEDTSLAAIAQNPGDVDGLDLRVAQVGQSLRQLQVSPEQGSAAMDDFRAKATAASVTGLLAAGSVDAALARFEERKGDLGGLLPDVERAIAHAKATKVVADTDVAGEQAASKIFRWAVDPNTGWVDAENAMSALDDMDPGKVKDEARQRLEHRLQLAEKAKKTAVDNRFDSALASYRKAGTLAGVSPNDKAWLQNPNNEPEAWEKLRRIAQADASYARELANVQKRGVPSELAEARREQAERDKEARLDFLSLPADERAKTKLEVFLAGRGVSPVGAKQLGVDQRVATDQLAKPAGAASDDFARDFEKAARGVVLNKKGTSKFGPDAMEKALGRATLEYQDAVAANGGKPLDEAARTALKARLLRTEVLEPHWYGDTKGPAVLAPRTAPIAPSTTPAKVDPHQAALDWLSAHPGDPRAPAIRKKLGLP